MTLEDRTRLLELLDFERRTVVYPGSTRSTETGVIRDISTDGKSCEIVYSSCSEKEVDKQIANQIQCAKIHGYDLEWKVYGHDQPACLGERLSAAGFEAGDRESFMVFSANEEKLALFGDSDCDIRRVNGRKDLTDSQLIMQETTGKSCEKQVAEFAWTLERHPESMSLYIAYCEGEPATFGRVIFHEESKFAALYGGQTRVKFRKRGLYLQMVAVRIREALNRGVEYVCIDALPTSQPILSKRGFESVTYTQPFAFSPTADSKVV